MSVQAQTNQGSATPWATRKIESIGDVSEALAHLNLPKLSEEVLRFIATSEEKGRFKNALQECVGNNAVNLDTKRYLTGFVLCLSNVIAQSIETVGYPDVPFEARFYIARTNGMAFRSALNAALTPNDPNHSQAAAFVSTSIKEAMEHIGHQPTQRATAQSPAVPRAAEPSASAGSPESSEIPVRSRDEDDGEKASFVSTHAYGGKAALCFNAGKSKDEAHFTIIVDGAEATGERQYDWKNAVKIQLSHKELPLLYGVLVGWRNSVKFDAHGAGNNKAFEMERQDGKLFAKVMGKIKDKSVARAVPIGAADAYPIIMVVLAQIIKEAPKELQATPGIIIQMMKEAQSIQPVGR